MLTKNFFFKALWFINSSVTLDIGFLVVSKWSLSKKIEFLFLKYQEIFLLLIGKRKFKLGESAVGLFGKRVYYDSPYGVAGYQSMLFRHQKMVLDNDVKNIRTIVDVGANVGFFSMMMKENFPNATIYAIEPVPQIFNCLQKNLTDSLDKTFNLAISDTEGKVNVLFNEYESATSHVVDSLGVENLSESATVLSIESCTLDAFCSNNNINFIDFLKIDTETFEAHVLRGSTDILAATKYLHIEINIEGNKNYSFSQLNSLLYSQKFNFQLIAFRNFTDKGDGYIPVGDFLYENLAMKK